MSSPPPPDQIEGAPHPRDTATLYGQVAAQQTFLDAFNADRLHHGWLLTGPAGIGKATLAWQIARFLLATPIPDPNDMFGAPPPPETLAIQPDHPVARRIAAGADPGLASVKRTPNDKGDRLRANITVEDIRNLANFFQLSATDGGRRVVIVDSADEMNTNAANALLKMLEEPPARATLLLISHQPSRLLPTIRSRCRSLRLSPLSPADMALALGQAGVDMGDDAPRLAALSGGSVGAAVRLATADGLALYKQIIDLMGTLPNLDQARAVALADSVSGRGNETRLDLLFTLMDIALTRLARTGAMGHPPQTEAAPQEAQIFQRLAPGQVQARAWATAAQTALARAQHGRAVNLDPGALVLDTLFKLRDTARA